MPKAEQISSASNPLVKDVRRALARGGLTADGYCIAETFHLLDEAIASRCEVKAALASESARPAVESRLRRTESVRVAVLPDELFQSISATETSQGVMALVKLPEWKMEQLFDGRALVAVLDGLQDPGNAGSIVRAAEAFGATGVIFSKGSASPHNPKTLRASAGSLFRVPFVDRADAAAVRSAFVDRGAGLFAGVPAHAEPAARAISAIDLRERCGFVIGNEARGVSRELRAAAQAVSIPTVRVESLNAAMAAAIFLYEAARQRAAR
jgi:RNA methyltransferase, TrmH family